MFEEAVLIGDVLAGHRRSGVDNVGQALSLLLVVRPACGAFLFANFLSSGREPNRHCNFGIKQVLQQIEVVRAIATLHCIAVIDAATDAANAATRSYFVCWFPPQPVHRPNTARSKALNAGQITKTGPAEPYHRWEQSAALGDQQWITQCCSLLRQREQRRTRLVRSSSL
jgi:hypothetical protein